MGSRYDFVIVGGGSAGSALANRLSEDPGTSVLVLEAGRSDYPWDVFIHMPAALAFPIGSRFYDWKYESEPEPHMGGRRVYHARGKLLGGSSSINGMIFQRGNPMDYERWASDPGMESWDHAHCLPYFKRMENCLAAASDDPFRGHDGPLVLERGPAKGPLFDAFFEAVQQAGYPLTDDVNGYRQEGFAAFDRNVHDGKRLSAARAYLHPVMNRPNLTVETRAFVTKVRFEGGRAVGVEYSRRGRGSRTASAGEVILCGGAINSPQLLQLSGIGAASELGALGIDVVADVPGVGENLQDHLEVYIQHSATQPVTMAPYFAMKRRPLVGLEWLLRKTGPGATNHFEAGGFVRGNEEVRYPNLMYHFLPIAVRYDGTLPEGGGGHGYQVHVGPMYSDVRGTCKAISNDPHVKPALLFNYLSTENDRREWIEAIRVTRRILGAPAFEPYSGGELSPGAEVESDEQIIDWVARDAETALHPSCTCKMGTDDMSVVDPLTMRVHGVNGLRVVDASVFPYVTNGNIYAPVMMTAEKSADLILGNTPLPAEQVEFYRAVAEPRARADSPSSQR
ncbi:MAG TPA: choline dehydrogenase [Thermoleophilaceae bacterium]|nr:choline dehydrogenase [Thermoleophilaceae bacterium]